MPKPNPTNMVLEVKEHSDSVVSCQVGEFRYHVWLDRDTLVPRDGVMFKNPADRAADRRARTIKLDVARGFGAELWLLMKAAIPGLAEAAVAKLRADMEERERQAEEKRLVYLAKQAGPDLLAAARKVLMLRDPKAKLPPDWSTDTVYAELAQAVAAAEGRA